MIIEKLKKEDLRLYKKLIDEAFDESNDLSIYDSYDENNNNYEIIVAKMDNKIVGSITMYKLKLFTFSFQPMIELFNVCVLKEYQNKNIATKLFNFILDYAKENGYKSINLTCLDDAYVAHKFYESVGMKKTASIKYKLDL